MSKMSGMEAVIALREELEKQGVGRTSRLNGGDNAGWIEKNRMGSTGFSIRPLEDGTLDWHLVISGKPHMRYREYEDRQGDESYDLHEPTNPEVVYPQIKAAFAALGVEVAAVSCTGWRTMWDDDVDFNVKTAHPEWLSDWDPSNGEARASGPRF